MCSFLFVDRYVNPEAPVQPGVEPPGSGSVAQSSVVGDTLSVAPAVPSVLYEEYFHCTDLGIQLAPIITRFVGVNVSVINKMV